MKPKFPWLISATVAFLLMVADASAYYDPGVQRWISRDPIEERGGWNLYSFPDIDAGRERALKEQNPAPYIPNPWEQANSARNQVARASCSMK